MRHMHTHTHTHTHAHTLSRARLTCCRAVFQLETFRSWAGISSDISYYLNSHHVDFLTWSARCLRTALIANARFAV
jgi:hypothetical protein